MLALLISVPAGIAVEEEQAGFGTLLQQSSIQGDFEVRQSRHGQGIFVTRDTGKGQVGAPSMLVRRPCNTALAAGANSCGCHNRL